MSPMHFCHWWQSEGHPVIIMFDPVRQKSPVIHVAFQESVMTLKCRTIIYSFDIIMSAQQISTIAVA